MALIAGDRVAGRYEVVAAAPAETGILRYRAVVVDTGEPVEVLALDVPTAWAVADRRRFAEQHHRLAATRRPGVVHTWSVHRDGDQAWVVRDPLEDATLADVPGPIDPAIVAAVGLAVLEPLSGLGPLTHGATSPADIGITPDGRALLAPRVRPVTGVGPDVTRWVAPEAYSPRYRPDGAAGLYGLGVLLYLLATGKALAPVNRPAPLPPAPSLLRPGLPSALDQAILTLLSRDPNVRAGALPPPPRARGPGLRSPPPRPKRHHAPQEVRPAVLPGEVVYTTSNLPAVTGGASAQLDVRAGAALVIHPSDLAGLSTEARSLAAGWAELPVAWLDRMTREGRPLVFELLPSHRVAQARRDELARQTGLPLQVVAMGRGASGLVAAATVGGISAFVALLAAIVGVFLPFVGVIVGVIAGIGAVATAALLGRWWQAGAPFQAAKTAWDDLAAARRAWDGAGLGRTVSHIADLRRRLAVVDLPPTAAIDLRGVLKDIETQIGSLEKIAQTANQTLSRVDPREVRTRLANLEAQNPSDPAALGQRDRLARIAVDIEAVAQRRDALQQDIHQIEEALDEVAAVLGGVGAKAIDEAGLDRLRATTRQVRAAAQAADEEAEALALASAEPIA